MAQEGIVVEGAADAVGAAGSVVSDSIVGTVEEEMQESTASEPKSVVSGELIQDAPVYSEMAPMDGGTVISEGGAVVTGAPVDAPTASTPSCGCGGTSPAPVTYSSVPAPVVTYSSAPVQYSTPVANPCCNQPRRGFFRTLFGN